MEALGDPGRSRIESPEGTYNLVLTGLSPVKVHPAKQRLEGLTIKRYWINNDT